MQPEEDAHLAVTEPPPLWERIRKTECCQMLVVLSPTLAVLSIGVAVIFGFLNYTKQPASFPGVG